MTKNKTYKIVVVVDDSIKMTKGKLARQVAGAVSWSILAAWSQFKWFRLVRWVKSGIKTVVVKTDNLEHIMTELYRFKTKYYPMVDAGKTQFKGVPTRTCIGTEIIEDEPHIVLDNLKLL